MKHRLQKKVVCFLAPLALSGCATIRQAYEPRSVTPAPPLPVMKEANPLSHPVSTDNGSLWSADQSVNPFADDKAFRKGDVVLVNVANQNTGSKTADLTTARTSSITGNVNYALGAEKAINHLTGYTQSFNKALSAAAAAAAASKTGGSSGQPPTWSPNPLINASSAESYTGTGTTDRNDNLVATVSTVVIDVLSNGNLVVYGHQNILLNNETSMLTVQGIIRPADIAQDNSISSTRIVNADIQFTGSGALTDKLHPGWGTRIFDWVWPF